MCGICGVFSFENVSPGRLLQPIIQMTKLMQRRGPDDEGFWNNSRCGLGFRRLSILDLSPTGHQPMITQDERYVLVFNGEVYNFREIRRQLEQRGVRFRSTGDAEVVLYALAEWDTQALERFNGMFALGFYDTVEQTLLLARDHAGIKPLYYSLTSRGLVFASQFNQILAHPWNDRLVVSQDALSLYLRFGWIPAPYALMEHTGSIEAGCWLKIAADGKTQQGCHFEFPKYKVPTLHGDQAFDALDEALDHSVKRHLISDVPVGIFLSGGIDSPLVAAKASQHSDQRIKAFSIGVPDVEMNEIQDASKYANELGFNLITQEIDEQTAFGLLDDVVNSCTEPAADFSIFPTLLVSKLAANYVKVVLSGDGGDELFWGYPGRFAPVLDQVRYYHYPRSIRYGFIALRHVLGIGKATKESLWPDIGRLYQKKHTYFDEADLVACFPNLKPIPGDLDLFQYTGKELRETAQWLRWNEFRLHLARILAKVDRASMFSSLEVRVPLLDKEVLLVAAETDWKTCLDLKNRMGKIPLRKVLSRHVQHQTQAKKGFNVPMHKWLQGPLQGLVREKVLTRSNFLGQAIHQENVNRICQQVFDGQDITKAWDVWLLLSLVLWQEAHFSGTNQKCDLPLL